MNIFNKNHKMKWLLSIGSGFVPITNFPAFTSYSASSSLTPFINNLYTYAIGIAAILAVIEIIWGGFLWMGSGASVSSKEAGRSKITMAILGLVLVLSPYLILSILNPNMLSLRLGVTTMNINQKGVSTQTLPTANDSDICDAGMLFRVSGGCKNAKAIMKANNYLSCNDIKTSNSFTQVCLYNHNVSNPNASIVPKAQRDACAKIITSKNKYRWSHISTLWDYASQRWSSKIFKVAGGGCSGVKIGAGYACTALTNNSVCTYKVSSSGTGTTNKNPNKTNAVSVTQKQKDECAKIIGSVFVHPLQRGSSKVLKIVGGCSGTKAKQLEAGGKYICKDLPSPPKNYVCVYKK